jgi:hypothetical protein
VSDRIFFPGSPWPAGHPLESLLWTGRLEPGPELWFDLSLISTAYTSEDPDEDEEDAEDAEDEEDVFDEFGNADWPSRTVWENYHWCMISSTVWKNPGFRVGEVEHPLRLAGLTGSQFHVDDDPRYLHPERQEFADSKVEHGYYGEFAFGAYVLGPATVADHRIRFPRRHGDSFALDWRGRVSASVGRPHTYTFHATATGVRLAHIAVSPDLAHDLSSPDLLSGDLRRVLVEADDFALTEVDGAIQFVHRSRG